jgi:hypothetical protein
MSVPDLLPVLRREAEARFGRSLLPDAKLPVAVRIQDLHAAQGSERGGEMKQALGEIFIFALFMYALLSNFGIRGRIPNGKLWWRK